MEILKFLFSVCDSSKSIYARHHNPSAVVSHLYIHLIWMLASSSDLAKTLLSPCLEELLKFLSLQMQALTNIV